MSELIDKEALERAIKEQRDVFRNPSDDYESGCYDTFDEALSIIGRAPTVEARIKGKWIKRIGYTYDFKCSCCEYIIYEYQAGKNNFCPNCGAQMEG